MNNSELPSRPMPQLDLVVTNPPDRLILHPELGLFTSPQEAIRKLGKEYAYLSGEVIGLEWQTKNREAIAENDLYSRCFYMPASYYPEDHVFNDFIDGFKKQPPISIATLNQPNPELALDCENEDINIWIKAIRNSLWGFQRRRKSRNRTEKERD